MDDDILICPVCALPPTVFFQIVDSEEQPEDGSVKREYGPDAPTVKCCAISAPLWAWNDVCGIIAKGKK